MNSTRYCTCITEYSYLLQVHFELLLVSGPFLQLSIKLLYTLL